MEQQIRVRSRPFRDAPVSDSLGLYRPTSLDLHRLVGLHRRDRLGHGMWVKVLLLNTLERLPSCPMASEWPAGHGLIDRGLSLTTTVPVGHMAEHHVGLLYSLPKNVTLSRLAASLPDVYAGRGGL